MTGSDSEIYRVADELHSKCCVHGCDRPLYPRWTEIAELVVSNKITFDKALKVLGGNVENLRPD